MKKQSEKAFNRSSKIISDVIKNPDKYPDKFEIDIDGNIKQEWNEYRKGIMGLSDKEIAKSIEYMRKEYGVKVNRTDTVDSRWEQHLFKEGYAIALQEVLDWLKKRQGSWYVGDVIRDFKEEFKVK